MHNSEFNSGRIDWTDAAHIRVESYPETIEDTGREPAVPQVYIIDLRTK